MDKFNDALDHIKVYCGKAKAFVVMGFNGIRSKLRSPTDRRGEPEEIPKKDTRLPVVIAVSAVLVTLTALIVWAAFFSPINVSVTMPKQAALAAERMKSVSYSDIFASYTDARPSSTDVSGADVSGADISMVDKQAALFAYYLFQPISGSDVSSSDVSTSDISGGDVSSSEVIREDDGNVTVTLKLGRKATVADALRAAGIPNSEYLYISEPLDRIVSKDMNILLSLLVKVRVKVDGRTIETITGRRTVGEVLSDSDIWLGANDRISEQLSAEPRQEMSIVINRVEIKEEKRAETIPFETVTKNNSGMLKGEKKVVTEGKNGERSLTFRMTFVDGALESEEKIAEEITVAPVDKVVEIGTKTTTTTTRKTTAKTKKPGGSGRYVVSKEKVYDCDGSGHGYYVITYSDGTVEYKNF